MRRKGSERRSLPVSLTSGELLEKAEQHACLLKEQAELAEQHEALKTQMKQEKEDNTNAIAASAKVLRDRSEEKSVDVEILIDDESSTVYWVRTDTGDVFETRELKPSERQLDLVADAADSRYIDAVERFKQKARFTSL